MNSKYILGIDASLTSTGVAIIERETEKVVLVDRFITKRSPNMNEDDRIVFIVDKILEIIDNFNIVDAVIEDQYIGNNSKTAMKLSRLRGAISYGLVKNDVNISYIQALTVRKLIIGSKSSKEEIAIFLRKLYKDNEIVCNLKEYNDKNCKDKTSDMYDAIAIALASLRQQ